MIILISMSIMFILLIFYFSIKAITNPKEVIKNRKKEDFEPTDKDIFWMRITGLIGLFAAIYLTIYLVRVAYILFKIADDLYF